MEWSCIIALFTAQYLIVYALADGGNNCYGHFTKLSPTGASFATASGSGLSYNGVPASDKMAEQDKDEVLKRKDSYIATGKETCISSALIAALASRESRAGRLLYKSNGWGDWRDGEYHAYGILQCDKYSSGLDCEKYPWDSQQHMQMMVSSVLIDKIQCVQRKFPNWEPEKQLQGGVAAYNFGCGNVQSWENLDVGSAGGDYSNDVIARAQWFNTHVFASLLAKNDVILGSSDNGGQAVKSGILVFFVLILALI